MVSCFGDDSFAKRLMFFLPLQYTHGSGLSCSGGCSAHLCSSGAKMPLAGAALNPLCIVWALQGSSLLETHIFSFPSAVCQSKLLCPNSCSEIILQQVTLACKSKTIITCGPGSGFFTVVTAVMNLSRTVAVLSQIIQIL